jgi:hypothetical protein
MLRGIAILIHTRLICSVCGFEGLGTAHLEEDFTISSIEPPKGWRVESPGRVWCSQRCLAKHARDNRSE